MGSTEGKDIETGLWGRGLETSVIQKTSMDVAFIFSV